MPPVISTACFSTCSLGMWALGFGLRGLEHETHIIGLEVRHARGIGGCQDTKFSKTRNLPQPLQRHFLALNLRFAACAHQHITQYFDQAIVEPDIPMPRCQRATNTKAWTLTEASPPLKPRFFNLDFRYCLLRREGTAANLTRAFRQHGGNPCPTCQLDPTLEVLGRSQDDLQEPSSCCIAASAPRCSSSADSHDSDFRGGAILFVCSTCVSQ